MAIFLVIDERDNLNLIYLLTLFTDFHNKELNQVKSTYVIDEFKL